MSDKSRAVKIGMDLAHKVFVQRGSKSEVHLKKVELAALLAIAAEQALNESKK